MYSVLLKKSAGSGEKADTERLFGYLGTFTLFGLWWLGNGHYGNYCQHEFHNFSYIIREAAHYSLFFVYHRSNNILMSRYKSRSTRIEQGDQFLFFLFCLEREVDAEKTPRIYRRERKRENIG